MIKSQILIHEKVLNTAAHPNADFYYYQAYVVWPNGLVMPALFTAEQMSVAINRAQKQPEDIKPQYKPWYVRLLNLLGGETNSGGPGGGSLNRRNTDG